MAFCRYCGGRVNDGAMFCASCGRQLRKDIDNNEHLVQDNGKAGCVIPPPIPDDYNSTGTGSSIPNGVSPQLSNATTSLGGSVSFIPSSPTPQMSSIQGSYNNQGGMYQEDLRQQINIGSTRNDYQGGISTSDMEIDGKMGQILRVFSDHFEIETTDEYESYEPEARELYHSRGASVNGKGIFDEFADVGRELKSAFAEIGDEFSAAFAQRRKKKKGIISIPRGIRKEYYSSIASIDGINIGIEQKGYIVFKTKTNDEILFFFDGEYEYINNEVVKGLNENLKPKVYGQSVKSNSGYIPQAVELSEQPKSIEKNIVGTGDKIEQIKKLKELLDIDAITKEEFEKMKKEILG